MLPEISLNILDVAQNSISAEASHIRIEVAEGSADHSLKVVIADDGRGMTKETVEQVIDPFFTTRTTRKVGLGVPFLKQAAECTGGAFSIASEPGVGTTVTATFHTDNIDCMPLGDINATIHSLVTMNTGIDFRYERSVDGASFVLDTEEFREILGDVPFDEPEVSGFIRSFLEENESEIINGGEGAAGR